MNVWYFSYNFRKITKKKNLCTISMTASLTHDEDDEVDANGKERRSGDGAGGGASR